MKMRTIGARQSRRAASSRRAPGSCADRGVSLVEVVIAIALTGGVVVSILGALITVVRSSDQTEETAKVQAVIGGTADALADATWVPCPEIDDSYVGPIRAAAIRVGWDVTTVTIDDIDYWNPVTNDWAEECNGAAAVGTSERLQLVTVRVTSPDGRFVKSFDIVKSDTDTFAGASNAAGGNNG